MHRPRLLLLDEPSTGLDPGARHDLWQYLKRLQSEGEVSVLVTTHLMEEAEHCDRLGILDRGSLVALDTPEALRASIGGDCLTLRGDQPDRLAQRISEQFGIASRRIGDSIRIERAQGHELLREIVDAFPDDITTASLGKPTLEDVFIQRTGHRFWDAENAERGVRNAE
jgi:ABC-2 type transport system ATP-binding protein